MALGLVRGQLGSDTKVSWRMLEINYGGHLTELDIAVLREQNISSFDVAVDLALRVKILEADQQFTADNGDLLFAKDARLQLACQPLLLRFKLTRSRQLPPARYSITIQRR